MLLIVGRGMTYRQQDTHTALGLIAILLWGTTVAAYRGLAVHLGVFTAAACVYTLGGGIGVLYLAAVERQLSRLLKQASGYLLAECLCVVLTIVGFSIAVGSVRDPRQVFTVGMINYLWPALTLLLSIPLLRRRPRPLLLLAGTVLALAGVALASLPPHHCSLAGFFAQWQQAWLPYLLVFCAAVAWAVYSNLAHRWAAAMEVSGMPLFLLVSGMVMFVVRLFLHEQSHWSPSIAWGLLYTAIGPTLLAYVFWDIAMRKGRMVLLTSCSYLTPFLSTLALCAALRLAPGLALWLACALIIAGAVVCNRSFASVASE